MSAASFVFIEASAGSGKTRDLSERVCRYLQNGLGGKPVKLEEILVVTFTNKAARELRERIRTRLRDLSKGGAPSLLQALQDFDRSSILTMHGFCQRVLAAYALECRSPFDMTSGEEPWMKELVRDFFETARLHPDGKAFESLKEWKSGSGKWSAVCRNFEAVAGRRLSHPDLEIEPRDEDGWKILREALAYLFQKDWNHKIRTGKWTFQDLLAVLEKAVTGRDAALRTILQSRYRVALIDEFQDTDPVQWSIFKNLFLQPGCGLVLVGDPKQAIYRFRGGDVVTYLKARREMEKAGGVREELSRNYRSAPALVEVLNPVFARLFAGGEPDFQHAESGQSEKKIFSRLLSQGEGGQEEAAPLVVTNFDSEKSPLSLWQEHIGGRIHDYLQKKSDTFLEIREKNEKGAVVARRRNLEPSDIAVLVESHREARSLEEILRARGIPVVLGKQKSLFQSDEAAELLHLLKAVHHPQDDHLLKRALHGIFFDLGYDVILELEEKGRLTAWQETFAGWKECLDRGKVVLFFELLFRHQGPAQVLDFYRHTLSRSGGERILTNVRHLAEYLHLHQNDFHGGTLGLVEGLDLAIREAEEVSDRELIRLDTDRRSVQIYTIHAAKGLEFPIVFLGGGFKNPSDTGAYWEYHGPDGGSRLRLKRSDNDENKKLPEKNLSLAETLSEKRRVLYVALTRAELRLHLPLWSKPEKKSRTQKSEDEMKTPVSLVEILMDSLQGSLESPAVIRERPGDFSGPKAGALPEEDAALVPPPTLRSETLKTRLKSLSYQSYSSLITTLGPGEWKHFREHSAVPAATENLSEEEASATPNKWDRWNLPGGNRLGNLLHECLEELDFASARPGVEADKWKALPEVTTLIRRKASSLFHTPGDLENAGSVIGDLLFSTLRANFPAGEKPFCLAEIGRQKRREMEFTFKVKNARVPSVLEKSDGDRLLIREGYLYGLMDLIFQHEGKVYLLDYKSNRLGEGSESYEAENLEKAMKDNAYDFQYLLYLAALLPLLKKERPDFSYERDFGGVAYLFLRGLSPGTSRGLYFSKPGEKELNRWMSVFLEAKA